MRKPLAIRIDADVLAAAKLCARQDNRTLTKLIETLLRQRIAGSSPRQRGSIPADTESEGSTRVG